MSTNNRIINSNSKCNFKHVFPEFQCISLAGHFSVHAQVLKREWNEENKTHSYCAYFLKSYNTVVARITFIDGHFGSASVYGLYSSTTRKHINWFFTHFNLDVPIDAIKVVAGNDDSYIVKRNGTLLVITDSYEVLWDETGTKQEQNKAVKRAVATMKINYTWNSYDCFDYIPR